MGRNTGALQRSLSLLMMAFIATQVAACRQEQSSQMSTQVAGRQATEKAQEAEKKIVTATVANEKTETPEPDQIPGSNTSGNAFTGVLEVKNDDGKDTKNTQCNFEILSKNGQVAVALNVGGYAVTMPLKKDWIKDAQSFSQEKLKAQVGKMEVMTLTALAQASYQVSVEDSRIGFLRETYIASEAALGGARLSDFIATASGQLATQKDYSGLMMISDGLYVTLDAQNKPQTFAYAKKEFVPGSGVEKANAAGAKSLEGSFKNTLVAYCSGLKSEKK